METNDYFLHLKQQIARYADERLQLLKLQSTEKVAVLVAGFTMGAVAAFCIFFVLLFAGIAIGFQVATYTNSFLWGFGSVSLFYLIIVLVVLVFFRKTIQTAIVNKVIETLLDDEEEPTANPK